MLFPVLEVAAAAAKHHHSKTFRRSSRSHDLNPGRELYFYYSLILVLDSWRS